MQLTRSELVMIGLLAFVAIVFICARFIEALEDFAIIVEIIAFLGFMVLHGKNTLGGKNLILFILIAIFIPFLMEYLGASGLFAPVCYWVYSDQLGPMFLGKVPYIIPLTWLAFLYCAYTMTNIICRRIGTERNRFGKLASLRQFLILLGISVVAGLIMTAWDLINDPVMVTRGYWSWPGGGEYYGIPLGNYLFWILTASLVFVIYNLYLGEIGQNQVFYHKEGNTNSRTTLMAILPYFMVFLFQAIIAIKLGIDYAIPWAAIAMGLAILLTIWRYYTSK